MRSKLTESASETVQDEFPTSSSFATVRMIHSPPHVRSASLPSSPVSALPSPPDSPSGGSVSSLPSIGSSFFYSSAAASPPRIHAADEPPEDYALRLVIPSLTLPITLPHPSPYGQTLGELKLLILGGNGIGKTTLANLLLESNDDIVHVSGWEGNVLTASTDWLDHEDNIGLERYEPALNVQITELPGYDPQGDDITAVVDSVLGLIHAQFKPVQDLLTPGAPPSSTLVNLLSSPYTPFYTALIILTPTSPSHFDTSLVEQLSPHIPVIALPPFPPSRRSSQHLSSFRPANSAALRSHLFRSPETLACLRMEAADRFLRWREVHRVHNALTLSVPTTSPGYLKVHPSSPTKIRWNKADWEAEWDYKLSKEVSDLHTSALPPPSPSKSPSPSNSSNCVAYYSPTAFDPLHLPSIFMFSLSLLAPLRYRIFGEPMETLDGSTATTKRTKSVNWRILGIVGAFCAGIGLGVLIAT